MREDQATSVAGGAEVDEEPGEVDDEDDGIVLVEDVVLFVLDVEPGAVEVVESGVLGAGATWIGR